ncbi:MAG: hypothetical protein AAGD86_09955, partial [Pseudomonadota bacterium]
DNDGDGLDDTADPDCYAATDPREDACSDGSAYCERWCVAREGDAVRCVAFDDPQWLATMARTWQPKHGLCRAAADPNQCMSIDAARGASADSAGALRLENPLDLNREMARSGSLPIQFNDDGVSSQFGLGSDFWVQYDMRVDQPWIDHLSPKQIYINEGDQADWRTCVKNWSKNQCAASCTDMEIVAQESSNLNYYDLYHGCPGPQGNKRFQYKDSTTADGNPACGRGGYEFRRQLVDGLCCSNDPSDCVYFRAGEWFRYWMHVTVGPDWDAADDRVEVFIRRPGDTARVRVVDSDVSGAFGDKFRSRLRNCGYCSTDSAKKCWTSDDCGAGQCVDRQRCGGGNGTGSGEYGKIWINNRSKLHGTPAPGAVAYAWYDNLTISRGDPGDSAVEPRSAP